MDKLTKAQLLEKCSQLNIKGASKNKTQLIELLSKKKVDLFKILEKFKLKDLSIHLNVSTGTIVRWNTTGIPKNYEFDILKLDGIKIDYSKYSSKQKDQFFTPAKTAKHCFERFCELIKQFDESPTDFKFIEPSAGDGNFLKVLPSDTIAMDIEPKGPGIIEQDYLTWKPATSGDYVVFGNPPFGLRGHSALKFINHSYEFAEYVCFILPQLFESDGKGVPRKRVIGFNLIYSEKIETTFYEPDGNEVVINTIFQIWSKNHINTDLEIKDFINDNLKIYSLSDGGTPGTTRNKKFIDKCDVYIPSTCFGKENMRCYDSFEDLPGKKGYGIVFTTDDLIDVFKKIDLTEIAFLSTNSAYNLRSSQILRLI